MSTKNPRINVTLDIEDLEIVYLISKKKKMSMSSVIKHMVHDWLEDYEEVQLARHVEDLEEQWKKRGCPTLSHEEMNERTNLVAPRAALSEL